ncbi:hypothetical protein [Rhizobium sp. PDO1-076]
MKQGNLPAQDVAKRMGVSGATLYRHLGKYRDNQEALAFAGADHG